MQQVYDYTDFFYDRYKENKQVSFMLNLSSKGKLTPMRNMPLPGEIEIKTNYCNRDLFLCPDNLCVYCQSEMREIHCSWGEEDEEMTEGHGTFYKETQFYLCQKCGWWHNVMFEDWDNYDYHQYTFVKVKGTLKIFNISDYNIPLSTLNDEIKKNPNILNSIHHKKMEEVVQYVFKGYFDCEVKHCGKSHDGGIDLLVLDSENPIAVQVKRRMKEDYVEPVSIVREFLGAMIYQNTSKGIFVSTAEKFSSEAVKFSKGIIENRNIEKFELMDKDRFLSIFNFIKTDIDNPFDKYRQWKFENIITHIENPYQI